FAQGCHSCVNRLRVGFAAGSICQAQFPGICFGNITDIGIITRIELFLLLRFSREVLTESLNFMSMASSLTHNYLAFVRNHIGMAVAVIAFFISHLVIGCLTTTLFKAIYDMCVAFLTGKKDGTLLEKIFIFDASSSFHQNHPSTLLGWDVHS